MGAAALSTGLGVQAAHASTNAACSGENLCPSNTAITAKVKSGTKVSIRVNSPLGAITAKCTTLTAKFKTPASGLTAKLSAPPKVSGCSDSLGGTDTIKTSGTWKFTANSTGTAVTIAIPVDAATFQSTDLPGCTLTLNPSTGSKLKGAYDETTGVASFTGANPGKVSPGASCPAGTYTEKLTAKLKTTPIVRVG